MKQIVFLVVASGTFIFFFKLLFISNNLFVSIFYDIKKITVETLSATKMHNSIIFCVSVSLSLLSSVQCELSVRTIIKQTLNGPVEGVELPMPLGSEKFYAFLSIPYAKAPITGLDPHTGKMVDRRFKVQREFYCCICFILLYIKLNFTNE